MVSQRSREARDGAGRRSDVDSPHPHERAHTDERIGAMRTRAHLASLEQGILIRVEIAAVLLGIGRTMMYELIKRGAIPVVRIGRRTLVHRTDLERFAEEHRRR